MPARWGLFLWGQGQWGRADLDWLPDYPDLLPRPRKRQPWLDGWYTRGVPPGLVEAFSIDLLSAIFGTEYPDWLVRPRGRQPWLDGHFTQRIDFPAPALTIYGGPIFGTDYPDYLQPPREVAQFVNFFTIDSRRLLDARFPTADEWQPEYIDFVESRPRKPWLDTTAYFGPAQVIANAEPDIAVTGGALFGTSYPAMAPQFKRAVYSMSNFFWGHMTPTPTWTEPAVTAITSTWTEPAVTAISSTWTEPAVTAVTSTWTEAT